MGHGLGLSSRALAALAHSLFPGSLMPPRTAQACCQCPREGKVRAHSFRAGLQSRVTEDKQETGLSPHTARPGMLSVTGCLREETEASPGPQPIRMLGTTP